MKVEMQLTERDKKLLIFLAIFCIVVGIGYWGIYPQIKAISKINEDIADEEQQMFVDDMKIAELPFLEDENEELEEDIVEARTHFYPMMTSDQVDKMLTGMVLEYNLWAYDLNIIMPKSETDLEAYVYSEKYVMDQMEAVEDVDMSSDDDDDEDDEDALFDDYDDVEVSTGIYTIETNMRLGGSEDDLQKLIDDLSATEETMHLVSYEWTRNELLNYDEETAEFFTEPNLELRINLDIYVYEE